MPAPPVLSTAARDTWVLPRYQPLHGAPPHAMVVVGGVVSAGRGLPWQFVLPESVNVPSSGTNAQS
jgi:hypothetical protein